MKNLSDYSVANMPSRVRLERYHQEKNQMMDQFPAMSQTEKDERLRELAKKWRI